MSQYLVVSDFYLHWIYFIKLHGMSEATKMVPVDVRDWDRMAE